MKIKAVFRRSGVRLALFLLVLCLIFRFCNTFMIKVDLFAYLALDELEHTDGIELAVVGSSLVQNHVNPEIIEEITGKSTYNASVPYMSYPGAYALTDQMLDHNSPEQIVLVVDPVGFCSTAESIESQFRLTPHLKGFARRARYFMDVCRENGNYLERLFLFRTVPIDSMDDVKRAIRLRRDPLPYYEEEHARWGYNDFYRGRGYIYYTKHMPHEEIVSMPDFYAPLQEDLLPTPEANAMLLRLRDLCEKRGAQFTVLIYPYMREYLALHPECAAYCEVFSAFCAENGVACFDLNLARPELLPDLTPHYADPYHHLAPSGAELLSAALGDLLTRLAQGEDVSPLFYGAEEAPASL